LRGFLGVLPRAGDTRRKTIRALTVALDELIGGVWILSAQCLYERGIAIDCASNMWDICRSPPD